MQILLSSSGVYLDSVKLKLSFFIMHVFNHGVKFNGNKIWARIFILPKSAIFQFRIQVEKDSFYSIMMLLSMRYLFFLPT